MRSPLTVPVMLSLPDVPFICCPSSTVSENVVAADAPFVSVAVTRTTYKPMSFVPGVPENARVEALKLNQAGNDPPPSRLAEYVIASPSGSLNVFDGTVYANDVDSGVVCDVSA